MYWKTTFFSVFLTFAVVQVNGQEQSASINIFDILKGAVSGARSIASTIGRSAGGVIGFQGQIPCFENLGCFEMDSPWFHSILRPAPPPDDPQKIQTKFYFSNRLMKNHEIISWPSLSGVNKIRFSPVDKGSRLYVIIHGYVSGVKSANWTREMRRKLLSLGGQVVLVDWSHGANTEYFRAVSNTRVVGREITLFLRELSRRYGISMKMVHLIGHSLGAQVAGLVGKNFTQNKLYRITGLDPAQPGFEFLDSKVHLWKTDAELVDVIHTSARPFIPLLGFGMLKPIGHLDFYINGGAVQPFCLDIEQKSRNIGTISSLMDLVNKSADIIADLIPCSHSLAVTYFMDSLNSNCTLWGKRSLQVTINASATLSTILTPILPRDWMECTQESCAPIGLQAFATNARGTLYVTTNKRPPYCWKDRKVDERLGKFLKE